MSKNIEIIACCHICGSTEFKDNIKRHFVCAKCETPQEEYDFDFVYRRIK